MTPQVQAISHEYNLKREQIELIKSTCCKGASDEELRLFLWVAKKHRLDPLTRQLHAIKRWVTKHHQDEKGIWVGGETMTIQVGIDGYRSMASRYKDYGGIDEPEYEYEDGNKRVPSMARVRVWKKGFEHPTIGVAYWDEYAPKDTKQAFMWEKMPRLMLAKCAEALALRKAYPELSDIYVDAELDQEAQNYTPEGRQITDKNGFAPDGRPVTYEAQHGSRAAAQAVATRKIAEAKQQQPIQGEIVDEMPEQKPDPSWPSITIDWSNEASPVVTGDPETFKPLFDAYCKWGNDGFWHTEPRHAESIRSAAGAMHFRLVEILPKSFPNTPRDGKRGKEEAAQNSQVAAASSKSSSRKESPMQAGSGASKEAVATASEPQLVSGIVERVFATIKGNKSFAIVTLKTTDGHKREAGCWDKDIYEYLDKGKGKPVEVFFQTKGQYTNLVGLKRIGSTEFENGKVPVIQRDREPGKAGNLFQP